MQDNELELNSQPLPISFSSSKSKHQHYRGISASTSSSQQINQMHQPIQFIAPQSKLFSENEIENTINYKPLKQFEPLNILTTPINIKQIQENINENSISDSLPINIHIPSLVSNTTTSNYGYHNALNSYLVSNSNCAQVLSNINNILDLQFNDNIEYKINYNNNTINGLVFLHSYHMYFKIDVFSDYDSNNIIFEFNRISGDSLASAKFWSQIKGYYTQIINGQKIEKNNEFDFIEFNLDLPQIEIEYENEEMNMNNNGLNKNEMDSLMKSLINNDLFILDELNFLYELIISNKQIGINILKNNKYLMKELINKILLNNNICVCRIVLLILNQLIEYDLNIINFDANKNEFKLFENINLLLKHKTDLIKKYTIKLLKNLLIQKDLKLNENQRKELVENIKKYENVCTNKRYYQMIQIIYQKLN